MTEDQYSPEDVAKASTALNALYDEIGLPGWARGRVTLLLAQAMKKFGRDRFKALIDQCVDEIYIISHPQQETNNNR